MTGEAADGRLSDQLVGLSHRRHSGKAEKRIFVGTIEQMLEAEMDEHLGHEKNSIAGNNSGNSRKQDVCAAAPKVRHGRRTT